MKKYFYIDGTIRRGPFTLEELKKQNIKKDTKVWFHGLNEWTAAGLVPELKDVFVYTSTPAPPPPAQTYPPANKTQKTTQSNQTNRPNTSPPLVKNYLMEAVLSTLFCCLPLGLGAILYATQVNKKLAAGDYIGAKAVSAKAKQFTNLAFILGGLFYLIVFLGILLDN